MLACIYIGIRVYERVKFGHRLTDCSEFLHGEGLYAIRVFIPITVAR